MRSNMLLLVRPAIIERGGELFVVGTGESEASPVDWFFRRNKAHPDHAENQKRNALRN